MKVIVSVFLVFCTQYVSAQLGFCGGSKGVPIFNETFGSKSRGVDKSAIGITTYNYVENIPPEAGTYTISNKFNWFPTWFDTEDHTEKDKKGNALIINVDENAIGSFFRREISGLCAGMTYEFSAWLLNLSTNVDSQCTTETSVLGGLPVNIRFEIWDETDTTLLKSGNTGQIFSKSAPSWEQYGMTFQTVTGQESIILKISNYSRGGCGNDLALDDIQFASCGDETIITTNTNANSPAKFCGSYPEGFELKCTSDFSMFKTHFYQWQHSNDGEIYTNIRGQNGSAYKLPKLVVPANYYYRVIVAENAIGLENSYCNSISESFKIEILELPKSPVVSEIKDFCSGEEVTLSVEKPKNNISIHWYDSAVNGKVLSDSVSYSPGKLEANTYTYYVASRFIDSDCVSERVPITVKVHPPFPALKEDETIVKCPDEMVILDSELDAVVYLWNTGETTKTINITAEGTYSVTVHAKNNEYCKSTRNFKVKNIVGPEITRVISERDKITIVLEEKGDFEYSMNKRNFHSSPVFTGIKNGSYEIFAKRIDSCNVIGPAFHFVKLF